MKTKRYFVCENCTELKTAPGEKKGLRFQRMQISGANYGGLIASEQNIRSLELLAKTEGSGVKEVDADEYNRMSPAPLPQPTIRPVGQDVQRLRAAKQPEPQAPAAEEAGEPVDSGAPVASSEAQILGEVPKPEAL